MLIVLAGLPGTGKSTIAAQVARELHGAVLSVDPIEAAMWVAGVSQAEPTGLAAYIVAEAVAAAQLAVGADVVIDAVNDEPEARAQWRDLAARAACPLLFVELVCPDETEHRRRLETRRRTLPDFPEPTWDEVQARRPALAAWDEPRLTVDTTGPAVQSVRRILAAVRDARAVGDEPRPPAGP